MYLLLQVKSFADYWRETKECLVRLGRYGKSILRFLLVFEFITRLSLHIRGSQRDGVYLGWPIEPKREVEGWGCGVSANEYSCAHGAQMNFGDLTPYLTYASYIHILAGNFLWTVSWHQLTNLTSSNTFMKSCSIILASVEEEITCKAIDIQKIHDISTPLNFNVQNASSCAYILT